MFEKYWFTGVGQDRCFHEHCEKLSFTYRSCSSCSTTCTNLDRFGRYCSVFRIRINTIKRAIKTVKEWRIPVAIRITVVIMLNILLSEDIIAVGILTVGLAEYVWYYPRVMIIFWVIVGLLFATNKIAHSKNNSA